MKKILVPVDGSQLSRRALPYAATLAHATGARLLLLRAASAAPFFKEDLAIAEMAVIGEAEADIAAAEAPLRGDGLEVESRVPYGPAAPSILDEAKFGSVDLIVMSTHGRGGLGRWIYGSVTDDVLRGVEVPVLVVPPGARGGWAPSADARVVVPLDGSILAEEAIGPAAELAAALGATIVLLRVVEPFSSGHLYGGGYAPTPELDSEAALAAARSDLEEVAERLRGEVRRVEVRAAIGSPAGTIAAVAHELGGAAIALATHGRGGLARVVLGSIATGLLQRADVPVLLVRPVAMRSVRAEQPGSPTETNAQPERSIATAPSARLEISAEERELIECGLELLLESIDREPSLSGPIKDLIYRIQGTVVAH